MKIDIDLLWEILREQNCSTKPFTDATCVVLVKKPQITAAIKEYNRRKNVISNQTQEEHTSKVE
jgi:hypothetical protein